jgi:DNA-binding HxlR family transcriptional regulator
MKWAELSDNWCPVARSLSVVGDRWTFLILRDCFMGLTRFDQFVNSTGLTRHVLADRLKRLVEAGVLERRMYSPAPQRFDYVLTDTGRELEPALETLADWGKKHMPVRRVTSG